MKALVFILLYSLPVLCFGQSESYSLKVNFYPSFHYPSNLKIKNTVDSCYIRFAFQIDSTGKQFKQSKRIKHSSLTSLTTFLKTYKFQIKGNVDTISVTHQPQKNDEDWIVYHIDAGTDGITAEGEFNQQKSTKKFKFWSPKKNSENEKLIKLLFDLMDNTFKQKKIVAYLDTLKWYYKN